jgi:twitching motility protein PilU
VQAGLITQEEALANADSATNLLWLLNNGPDSQADESANKSDEPPAPTFTEFTAKYLMSRNGGAPARRCL